MQRAAQSQTSQASQALSWEASVSAWIDGEGEGDLPSMLTSSQGRRAWDTYHLIGDALRSAELAVQPSADFQARLVQAVEAEPPIVAAPRRRVRLSLSAGLAMAAVAAAVVWVVQPQLIGQTQPEQAAVVAKADDSVEEAGLRDYLYAHSQVAGPFAAQVSYDVMAGR